MSRRLKWSLRSVLGGVVIAALGLLILSALLPVLARQRVELVLRDLGVGHSAFQVTRAAFDGIQLNDVRLGHTGWLQAGEVHVNYTAASLWQSRVKHITFENAVYRIAHRDGQLQFGFDPQPGGESGQDVPLSSVTLRDCIVEFEMPALVVRARVDGVFVRESPGVLRADLRVRSTQALTLDGGQVQMAGFEATLPLMMRMRDGELLFSALGSEAVALVAHGLTIGDTTLGEVRATVDAMDAQPLIRMAWGERERGLWMSAALRTSQQVNAISPAIESVAEQVNATLSYAAPEFASPQISGIVELKEGALRLPHASLEFQGVSIKSPFAVNAPLAAPGTFEVRSVAWKDVDWPGFAGTLAINGMGVEAAAQWSPTPSAVITASTDLSIQNGALHGELIAQLPPFEWTDDAALARLFPNANALEIGGKFSADAQLNFSSGAVTPRIELRATNASLTGPEWPVHLESFSSAIAINSFNPLQTEPDQRIEIHRATIGETPIVNGAIAFAVNSLDRISIREASWSMGELGQFQTNSFTFNPRAPRITAAIDCDDVELAAWLKLLTEERIHGEGVLSGQLTLSVQPLAHEKFRIREGYLYAEPAGGWIQTDDSEAISRIVDSGTASLSGDARIGQVRDRLVAALQDYQYTMLRLHFIPEDEGLLCRVTTKGRGRRGPDPQQIESLTINLHGFDDALRAALAGQSLWQLTD